MSLEPWPPLHRRREFWVRLIRATVLTIAAVLVIINVLEHR